MARMMNVQNEAEDEAKTTATGSTVMNREEKAAEVESAAVKPTAVVPVVAAPLVNKSSSAAAAHAAAATEAKSSSLPITTRLMNSKQPTGEMEMDVSKVRATTCVANH